MTPIDYVIVVVYLAVIAGIGLAFARGQETAQQYFLADRRVPQWAVGFTLMATLISSNTLVAHPAIVYQKGMILVPGFVVMPFVLVFVALVVVPYYRRVVGMSAYEFIGERFGLTGQFYTAFGFLMSRTFGIAVALLTTSIAVNVMTGWPLPGIVIGLGAFTMIYTMIGGITAVVWTDFAQGLLLMAGGILILLRLLFAPEAGPAFAVVGEALGGGRFGLGSFDASPETLFDPNDRTVYMFMLAMTVQWSRRYICDQAMVQRYLIAGSTRAAVRGTLTGAALSIPVLLTFNLIGACLYGFFALTGFDEPAVGDHVLPYFVVNYMPSGFIGLMLAAVLAASMSSISSDLNSIATVSTRDYLKRFFPGLTDRAEIVAGRIAVVVAGVAAAYVGVLLIPTEQATPLAERALVITVIVSSGVLGLFCLGFLTRRATRRGCYIGIAASILFTLWAVLTEPATRAVDLGPLNFELNAILIGILSHVVLFVVGYMASLVAGGYRPSDATLDRLQLFPAARTRR
ncbi:MAG: hypothetical protein AAFX58_03080 [Pseudomonadota bacterium]